MRASSLLRAGAALSLALAAAPAGAADARHPLVIELFQSQGCSSCPPANANLFAWAARDDALALNFAVDYWDSLGWKDTFAKPAFTARQWAYARALGHGEVYTPQTIVNGRADVTGADAAELAGAGQARGSRRRRPGRCRSKRDARVIGAGEAPPGGAEVWLVRYDPATREVAVKRGENAGRLLPHAHVVVDLVLLGRWRGEARALRSARQDRSAARRRRAGAGGRDRADPRRRQRTRRVTLGAAAASCRSRSSFCICSSRTGRRSRLGRGAAWSRA